MPLFSTRLQRRFSTTVRYQRSLHSLALVWVGVRNFMVRHINPRLAPSTSAWLTGAPITLDRNQLPLPSRRRECGRKRSNGLRLWWRRVCRLRKTAKGPDHGSRRGIRAHPLEIHDRWADAGRSGAYQERPLFAGDVRGNLFAFDAKSGSVLNRIDVNGALNGGLISYAVDGIQYIAAAVGGVTLNPAGVGGALKVSVYGLNPADTPKVVAADRLPPQSTGTAANAERYFLMCGACHGDRGQGRSFPSLVNHPELADPDTLGRFLATVPPPMPRLYPGPLDRDDLRMIASYMRVITGGSTPQWDKIYSVLSSPRCLNCHTMTDFPRQTDGRYAHIYGVTRGADDKGAGTLRCTSCHESINNQVTGIPGAPDWHAAPLSMAWESAPRVVLSSSALCATFKDKAKNGNRDLGDLEHHVATDPFVLWAWSPGSRPNGNGRLTPPITHDGLVQTIKEWAADGASCPTQ